MEESRSRKRVQMPEIHWAHGRLPRVSIMTKQAMKTGSQKPAPRRSSAVVRAGEVYSLAELRRRLQWKEHAVRMARVAGLRLVTFGRTKYVLGSDVLRFFERLADQQAGRGEP